MTDRVLVFGGRSIVAGVSPGEAQQQLTNICFDRLGRKPDCVIEGGAWGYDRCGRIWAKTHGIPYETYEADWDTHGKSAGMIRNQQMIDEGKPTLAIGFPGGRGTADMKRRVLKAEIPLVEVDAEPTKG